MGSAAFDDEDLLGPAPVSAASQTVAEADLARLWGVTARRVRELATDGVIERAAPGRFYLEDSTRRYCEMLRKSAGGGRAAADPDLKAERLREIRERADKLAAQNARLRGELVPARDVEREWASVLRAVRAAMLATPSRVQTRLPHLTAHDVSEIDHEIRAALQEASDDQL